MSDMNERLAQLALIERFSVLFADEVKHQNGDWVNAWATVRKQLKREFEPQMAAVAVEDDDMTPRLTEDEVRELQARIAELESLPKELEGSGYNPQQCGRIIKLYWEGQEKLNQIAALEVELQKHSDAHIHDDSEIKRTAAGIEGIIADRLHALLAHRTAKPEGEKP